MRPKIVQPTTTAHGLFVTLTRTLCARLPFTIFRVHFRFHFPFPFSISCFSTRPLSRDSKSCRTLSIAGYAKDAIVDACHRTSDGQEHKIIWRAGPEQDTILYLRVTACREQGSHYHDERLAWVASRGQSTLYSNSFVSKVLGAN